MHVAITYAADGTTRVYRDGVPYGKQYRSAKPVVFPPGEAVILFGHRHTPAGATAGLRARSCERGCMTGRSSRTKSRLQQRVSANSSRRARS